MSSPAWNVTAFYRFFPISESEMPDLRARLRLAMEEDQIRGLVIVAPEGINGTVASLGDLTAFKTFVQSLVEDRDVRFKDSVSEQPPFKRTTVVIRSEIVGLKRTDLVPETVQDHHLTPAEWHAMLSQPNPPLLIDTRNDYEVGVGKFKGAIDPGIRSFSQWSEYLQQSDFSREEPVMIYCTGGIRCEKAILAMREEGFQNIYQLRDGILGYLEEYPEGLYEGECYVFDDRVAVDAQLQPTQRFGTCPGCGLAAEAIHQCTWCGEDYHRCSECDEKWPPVCSKTCKDRYDRHGAPTQAQKT